MATLSADSFRRLVPELKDASDAEVAEFARQVLDPQADTRQFQDAFLGPSTLGGAAKRGLETGLRMGKAGLDFAAGGVAGLMGGTEAADAAFRSYDENQAGIRRAAPRRGVTDVRSMGDAVDLAAYYAGAAVPTLAGAALTGGAGPLAIALAPQAVGQGAARANELLPQAASTGQRIAATTGMGVVNALGDALIPGRIAAGAARPGLRGIAADVGTQAAIGAGTPLAERAIAAGVAGDEETFDRGGGLGNVANEMLEGGVSGAVTAGVARPAIGVQRFAQRKLAEAAAPAFARFRRTATDEIDLTRQVAAASRGAANPYAQYDRPAYQRAGREEPFTTTGQDMSREAEVARMQTAADADLLPRWDTYLERFEPEPSLADLQGIPDPPRRGVPRSNITAEQALRIASGVESNPDYPAPPREQPVARNDAPIYVARDGAVVPPEVATADPALVQRAAQMQAAARMAQAAPGQTPDMLGARRREQPVARNDAPIYVARDGAVVPPEVATADSALVQRAAQTQAAARMAQATPGQTPDMFGAPPSEGPSLPQPAAPLPPAVRETPEGQRLIDPSLLNVGDLLRELNAASRDTGIAAMRGGQPVGGKSKSGLKAILESRDPLAAMREAFQDGGNDKAELLDAWHERLTGEKISARQAQTEPMPGAPDAAVRTPPVAESQALGQKFNADADLAGRAQRGLAALREVRKRATDPDTQWNIDEDIKEFTTAIKGRNGPPKQAVENLERRMAQLRDWEDRNPGKVNSAGGFNPARWSQGTPVPPEQQLPQQRLQALVAQATANIPNAPSVTVLDSPAALPGVVDLPVDSNPSGGVVGGQIYLFRNALANDTDALKTVFHELLHMGVARTLPRDQRYDQMVKLANGSDVVRQYAQRWIRSEEGQQRRRSMPKAEFEALAVEEALADVSEDLHTGDRMGSAVKNRTVRSIIGWMAGLADRLRMPGVGDALRGMTFGEAERFIAGAVRRSGGPAPTGDTETRLRVDRDQGKAEGGDMDAAARLVGSGISFDAGAKVQDLMRDASSGAVSKALNLMTTGQIVKRWGAEIRGANELYEALQRKFGYEYTAAASADNVVKRMLALDKFPRDRLADLLFAATEAELHPDRALAKQRTEPTDADAAAHALLAKKFEALSPEAKRVYGEIRGLLGKQFEDVTSALKRLVARVEPDPVARRQRLAEIEQMIGRTRGPYFPLSRFGDFVVIGKNAAADGRTIVQHVESRSEQMRLREQMIAEGVDPAKIVLTRRDQQDYGQTVSSPFVDSVRTAIESNITDEAQRAALNTALNEIVLRALPAASGAKNFIRRRNVQGYSTDAARALADSVTRAGRYVSNLNFTPDMNAALADLRVSYTAANSASMPVFAVLHGEGDARRVDLYTNNSDRLKAQDQLLEAGVESTTLRAPVDSLGEALAGAGVSEDAIDGVVSKATELRNQATQGGDVTQLRQVADHLREKAANLTMPNNETQVFAALGQLAHIKYLGLSPAYWLTNLAQVPTMSFAHLSGKHGVAQSAAALGRAMRPASLAFKLMYDHLSTGRGSSVELGGVKGLNAQEREALQFMADRGQLDITQNSDLLHVSRGDSTARRTALEYITSGAHYTEIFNRMTTGLAAYRLARDKGSQHQAAMREALDDVESTQYNYAEYNKPALMQSRGPLGAPARTVFMFLQYAQNTMYWWGRNLVQATKGQSVEERAQAVRAMGVAAVGLGTLGGAAGLPLMGTVHMLANMAASLFTDDPGYDVEREIRAAIEEMGASPATAKALLRGVTAAGGVDLSQRVGQGDLLSRFGLTQDAAESRELARDPTADFMLQLMGPAVGVVTDGVRAVQAAKEGDMLKLLGLFPVKGVADLGKAVEYSTVGVRGRQGDIYIGADDLSAADIVQRGAGLTPGAVKDMYADRQDVRLVEQRVSERRSAIQRVVARAVMVGDDEGIRDGLADLQKLNASVAKYPQLQVSGEQMVRGVERLVKEQYMLSLTGGRAKTQRGMLLAQQLNPGLAAFGASTDPTGLDSVSPEAVRP